MIKLRLQNHANSLSSKSALSSVWRQGGLKELYKGVGPTAAGYLNTWAVYFCVYDWSKKQYSHFSHTLANTLSAFHGGLVSALVTNPIWVVRTRIMTQHKTGAYYYKSTWDGLITLVRKEGILAIYKGIGPSLLGVSHVMIQFPLYEALKDGRDQASHIMYASALSKVVAVCSTYPLEVIRTRLQTQASAPNPTRSWSARAIQAGHFCTRVHAQPRYTGVLGSFKTILEHEGYRGFYKGLGASLFRTVPASALTILSYEALSQCLASMAQ